MFKQLKRKPKYAIDLATVAGMLFVMLTIVLIFGQPNTQLFKGFVLNENFQVVDTSNNGVKLGVGPTEVTRGEDLTIILELTDNKHYSNIALYAVEDGRTITHNVATFCSSYSDSTCPQDPDNKLDTNKKFEIKWNTRGAEVDYHTILAHVIYKNDVNSDETFNVESRQIKILPDKIPAPSENCEKYFADMSPNHALCSEVAFLYNRGIFMGQNANGRRVANLNSYMNRAEYFAIAARLYDRIGYRYGSYQDLLRYSDITPKMISEQSNFWWMDSVLALDKIVKGYTDGTLRPNQNISMAELAKVTALSTNVISYYNDNRTPWYADIVDAYRTHGIYFDPRTAAKRGDAVKLIYDTIVQFEITDDIMEETYGPNF